jgi:tetratricopeptide (TPR) repeat protein
MTTHSLFKHLCMPAIAMLLGMTFLCPDGLSAAQDSGDSPLIVINAPGDRGDMLAVRVQALLDRYLPGQTVRQRQAPITSAESARRTGRLDGASLVVWTTQDTPDLLHTTTVIQPAVAPLPLAADLPLSLDETRLRRMLPLLVVGQAAALLNQAEAARAALSAAEALAPRDWPGRAEILYYRGQSQASQLAALEDYQAAFDLQPRWPYAHALAWAHDNLNEPRLALETIQQAIALAPDLPALYLDSAYFFEQTGDLAAAIAAYDAAQALSPADSTIYWRRAKANLATGDPASAQAAFDRLVALAPDDPAAYLARTDAGFARQNYQAVLDDVAAALALQPADPAPYLFTRGLALLYLGNHAAAIESLEDYTARRPGDPSGWINLGQAYEGAGNTVGAFHAFETTLGIDPEATYLHASLSRLYYTTALALSEPSRTHYLTEGDRRRNPGRRGQPPGYRLISLPRPGGSGAQPAGSRPGRPERRTDDRSGL